MYSDTGSALTEAAKMWGKVLFVVSVCGVLAKLEEDDDGSSGDNELEDSMERIGAMVTQVYQHPYAATLYKNESYSCSAIVLNTYWLLTLTKCFDSGIVTSYVTHKNLSFYGVRAGTSYNNKGGTLHKIKMLINNFDLRVSAVKLTGPMAYSSQLQSVRLPDADDDVALGFLASIIAWTPSGHMRIVNSPVIDPAICEANTKMLPGHFICMGGVQDPNRHFCRRDNGGAVIQNNTLVAISSFLHSCALYSKTHAFPKVASFVRWLDSVIWDESPRPTSTAEPPETAATTRPSPNSTNLRQEQTLFSTPGKYIFTLPFDPINVPLEPAEDNSVLPRMSLYESYLQSIARAKTSTTVRTHPTEVHHHTETSSGVHPPYMQHLYRMPKKYDRYDYH